MANEPVQGAVNISAVKPKKNQEGQWVPVGIYVDDAYDPPRLMVDALGKFNQALPMVYTEKLDYSSGLEIYHGWAAPGTATSAAAWAIVKFSYSGTAVTDKQWAGGTASFTQIWDNRTSLTYS